jgi:hypothetical protein
MSDTPGWTPPNPEERPPGWGAPPPAGPPQWGQPPGPEQWGQPPGQQWGQWGGGGFTPPTPKPGIIPLRPLGLGEILDGAITTIRTHPRATLVFAAAVATVVQVVSFLWTLLLIDEAESLTAAQLDSGDTGALLAEFAAGAFLLVVVQFVGGLLLSGLITAVIGQAVLGRPVSLEDAWARVRPRFWTLVGAALLGGLITFGGALLCILPGVYFYVAFSLATPALVLEQTSVTRSLRRSWDLVKGSWWRVFGIVLLAGFIASLVNGIITVPFGLAGGGFDSFLGQSEFEELSTTDLLIQTVGAIVAGTITGPFTAGVAALLYIDRRMRAEGLDVTLATAAATGTAGP